MSPSVLDHELRDIGTSEYIITHVFCPLQLPDEDHQSLPIHNDHSLARAIATAAHLYSDRVDQANIPQWHCILRMLENLYAVIQSESMDRLQTISQLSSMDVGGKLSSLQSILETGNVMIDVLALLIRAQNAGVVFRKQKDATLFESFELSPKVKDAMATEGKLLCSYPGPAIEIPNLVFDDKSFLSELAHFLVHMNHDDLHTLQQSSVVNDSVHPRYITELLTGILRGVGQPADIPRITKRVGDDVVCSDGSKLLWQRSPLWLLIKVALQTTLDRSPLGRHTYKEFMLFFMCCLAEKTFADIPSDLLQFMSAKISRRLWKFETSAPEWLSCAVLQTCTSIRSTIEDRWRNVQADQRLSPHWAPSQLNLTQDIQLSFLRGGDYLRNALASQIISPPDIHFKPEHRPRGALDDFLSSDGIFFEKAYRIEPHVTLYDVEREVEQSIDAWVDRVTNNDEACIKLEILAHKYSSNALEAYANNPELLSVMLLTTIELWIALDKIAVKEIPILADYSPEVPTNLLENLLLCKTSSLHRLCCAHRYLSRRHSRSRRQWSVFSSTITANSFAVRFYRKSSHLWRLKTRIGEAAQRAIREKAVELREKNARHAELQKRAEKTGRTDHSSSMGIDIHEWPLPTNQLQAEIVVFELDCPVSFDMWRTATFYLLVDLCSPSIRKRRGPHTQLHRYRPLNPYLLKHPRSRISIGSDSTSLIDSYPPRRIPALQQQVFLRNDWTFYGFDLHTGIPVSQALTHSDSRRYCTYKLYSLPYHHNLQKYVDTTSHTSNEVIANQDDCRGDLSIHEYVAFGHLRSGSLLQWLNILRELRGRSLNFRRHEAHLLLAQAASQVGPLAETGWTWHQEIQQPTFCHVFLGELENLARDVEANWQERVVMDTISFLLRRLLASSPDHAVSLKALDLLRAVRRKVFSWAQEISARFTRAAGDVGFRGVLQETAIICRSTFDVDPAIVSKLLHSVEDIEVLLYCAILVHDHMPRDVSRLPVYSQLLLDRDRRLSLALENVLNDMIQTDSRDQGINLAVGRTWPGYHPGSKWCPLPEPNSRWLWCTTAPPAQADQRPQVVHFNTLDGSVLIDGRPLGNWLPDEFVRHPLYKLIFGEQTLEITPSDPPGSYSTRGMISNHQVYLSLRNGSDLVIRAERRRTSTGDSEIIELVPHEKLEGDLPDVLIKGHAHWLNLSTSFLEIRPLESLWETSSENWKIDCTLGHYRMQRGQEFLVDIRCQSWGMVSNLLRPLATPQDLIVSVSPVDSNEPLSSLRLSVVLPRYGLSFYVDEDGDLQSHNIRGMIYDENQSIGALFGLVNQLVLRPKNRNVNALELIPRCVLIPDGDVSFHMNGHHVRVKITTHRSVSKRVTYQAYRVNTDLGCLTGDSSLTSKLYCAYLHALTSGCGIDPLTGRSGIEEALSVLQSATCWPNASARFSSHDADLLSLIASICPSKTWYSKQPMRQVGWPKLPTIWQYYELYIISKSIKERYERFQQSHEGQSGTLFQNFPIHDDHLLKHRARRALYLFPFRFSGQLSRAIFDVRYPTRDTVGVALGDSEHRAYTAATYVHHRTVANIKDIWGIVESWGRRKKKNVSGDTALSLQYDKSWLSPDLPLIWLRTYNLLRESDERKWFRMLFSLPAMAYGSQELSELVPVFVAFALHSEFCSEDPPHYDSYPISEGYHPSLDTLREYVIDSALPRAFARNDYTGRSLSLEANATAKLLLCAWPSETSPPCLLDRNLYDVAKLELKVQHHFSRCFRNLKLKEHLARVQLILDTLHSEASQKPDTLPYTFDRSQSIPSCIPWPLMVDQLLARPAPSLPTHDRLPRYFVGIEKTSNIDTASLSDSVLPLRQLIAKVGVNAANAFQKQYISALRTSAECFGRERFLDDPRTARLPTVDALVDHYVRCRASYIKALRHLQQYLGPRSPSERAVEQSGQWPRVTAHTLFRSLASNSPTRLPDDWKRCLTLFALLALELQRARRLVLLHFDNLHEEFCKELQNEGCDGWDAEAHPDWLLIQLQGNFLIRRVQAEVANEMVSPRSGDNTAMQLNMGEGKTSVILPIAAVALANGGQLVRVIIPKSADLPLLADRLGGLTNRRIYYLPFSRSFENNIQKMTSLHQIMLECMQECGILVVQPEHVLSLKLVSVEKQLSRTEGDQVAHLLLELQRWLHSHSRDILDESDDILNVRSQLVFTIGRQQHVEGSFERWTTTEQVLGLVSKHASSLRDLFPLGVEHEPGAPGAFPHLRILQADAGLKLISWIVQDVMEGLLPNISFGHLHSGLRDAIRWFISYEDVPPTMVRLAKEHLGQSFVWGGLLLLRGLLASGILLFPFRQRRWRVDYGLAPSRTMLAVPFRAKDVPAERAQFGHPDITIILTCLSYYYAGLSQEQLRLSFEILLKQDEAALGYDLWVRACPAVPESLRALNGVNIESMEQWDRYLYPLFSRNRATVNFYLSRVVFPRESKDFPSKLSTSGWDLAEKKERPVTGFSGTNDGQYLLPLHITQRDPDHQRGTNAKVLSYLLQPENKHYACTALENGKRQNIRDFPRILIAQKPEIRVLLDVGVQMLDLQNHELAKAWLGITPNVSAAIYFNEDDELMVFTRDGITQLLRSSPYARQLDQCVVYIDDAHTRGIDIKFPSGFRAAVTLGPKVTKDRLAQGCMRMRKLGHGHSIMFFAPLEIDRCIRSVAGKAESDVIDTMDILHWVIRETWDHIQWWAPHWARQGMDHASRYASWSSFCKHELSSEELSNRWIQPEAKRLEDLYEPRPSNSVKSLVSREVHQRCADLGVLSELWSVRMDEEQERELIQERELTHEQQVERPPREGRTDLPPRVIPARHSIHKDVVDFIKTGIIPVGSKFFGKPSKAFSPAFEMLQATSAASDEAFIWSQSVLVTTDFEKTVKAAGRIDDYLRPVHWVISAKRGSGDVLVILSPYEVNCLLPDIRSSEKVFLHVYTPRVTKSMRPCDDLALYSIPTTIPKGWILPSPFVDQLNVFAGQLYLKDYETYIRLCRFLCVYARDLQGEEGIVVDPDGFISPSNRYCPKLSRTVIAHTFASTPITSLRALMDLRSKGTDFTSTHMGKLLRGQVLSKSDFDGWDDNVKAATIAMTVNALDKELN